MSRGVTSTLDYSSSTPGQYDFLKKNNADSCLNSSYITEDAPDAASEKELGNEYFKQKKFKEAIDCYSRSALSPSAVAYANRAMTYLKLKGKFQEAEDDCTEALNLDDRYIKAYSCWATARKELGKCKQSVEDAEFALRLEPNNQEINKQYTEAKSLYDKDILQSASGALRSFVPGTGKLGNSETKVNGHSVYPASSTPQKSIVAEFQDQPKGTDRQFPVTASVAVGQIFKSALSSSLLLDIIKCIASFFGEEIDLAVDYLKHLTKRSIRFGMKCSVMRQLQLSIQRFLINSDQNMDVCLAQENLFWPWPFSSLSPSCNVL
ncbi:RNA polymerase II-associated protein 3 [Quillaja saponaria]|nr:RNA polymerase II-associated protein 3 [Quillaja saponaria]